MAARIRLTRYGRKKVPIYRIVVVDARSRRDGAYLENLGHYSPVLPGKPIRLNEERLAFWVQRGARLSESVQSLVARYRNSVTNLEGGGEQ